MQKLTNGVKSGQLWQIISAPIFNENLPNFREWCKNIQKLSICQMFRKQIFKIEKQKLLGVFAKVKIGLKKLSPK